MFVQQPPSLPTESQSEPGKATLHQWHADDPTAETEPGLVVCTLFTQWPVGWSTSSLFEVCTK